MEMSLSELAGLLIRRDRSHIAMCRWSQDPSSPDVLDAIWDAFRLTRITPRPTSPGAITDLALVVPAAEDAFLLACRFCLLERVLAHYMSQATSAAWNNRIEFQKRADGLRDLLYGEDRAGGLKDELDEALASASGGGVLVGERLSQSNVPDAACTPYRRP